MRFSPPLERVDKEPRAWLINRGRGSAGSGGRLRRPYRLGAAPPSQKFQVWSKKLRLTSHQKTLDLSPRNRCYPTKLWQLKTATCLIAACGGLVALARRRRQQLVRI